MSSIYEQEHPMSMAEEREADALEAFIEDFRPEFEAGHSIGVRKAGDSGWEAMILADDKDTNGCGEEVGWIKGYFPTAAKALAAAEREWEEVIFMKAKEALTLTRSRYDGD